MSTVPEGLSAPPVAPRVPATRALHGEAVADDYAWMRDRTDPALREYLESERAYYNAASRHLEQLVRRLCSEVTSRVPEGPEYSVAWQHGGFTYRTRMPPGSDYLQLLRSGVGETSERVLLDDDAVAAETGFADIGVREPSPDGSLLAWSADTSGAEIYELRIRDLRSGEDLPEVIERASGPAFTTTGRYANVAWGASSDHLFYLVPDELNRPFQVWRHRVKTAAREDVLLFEETDERFELVLERSRSGELAIITARSRDTTEVRLIPLRDPRADPVLIEPRRTGTEYRVDHARAQGVDCLYVVTDVESPEFTLMRAPLAEPGQANWTLLDCAAIAPARADTRLLRCDVLANHLVLSLRRGCDPRLAITDRNGGNVLEIAPGVAAGSITIEYAEEYDADSVIIAEESLIEPPAWYELDLHTGQKQLLKRMEVPGYDPARYRTERRTAPAPDGMQIPATLAYRNDTNLDGTAPCLLYGYGAYEDCAELEFERTLPSLLDRGVVFAVAHVRGGGECGRDWWQQGRRRSKPTTFTDFIAVADWLAGSGGDALVDRSRIVSRGLSAGGLLQGAVYSMRPDRWRAVVAEVPFVDCVSTMLDPSIPLTVTEWDEWGDPRDPDDYACIRSYSPYENPPSGTRPALLVTGALHDRRVSIHEPAKWVARLRATDRNDSCVLFRAELGVGSHTGPTGRGAQFSYAAEIQAFILEAMGISA